MRASAPRFGRLRFCPCAIGRGRVRSANSPPSMPSARPEPCLLALPVQPLLPNDVVQQHGGQAMCPSRRAKPCTLGHWHAPAAVIPVAFSLPDPEHLARRHRSSSPLHEPRPPAHCFSTPPLLKRGWNQWTPATVRAE